MIRVLRSLWIWAATATLVVLWVPLLGLVRLTDRDPARKRTARWFRRLGRIVARVNPWRLHISGREHLAEGGPFVVVSNHQSLADIPLISFLDFDAKWLAKAELFDVPVFGWLLRMSGEIPVQRGNRSQRAQVLLQAGKWLRAGVSVMFFPEGTRTRDGSVLPFAEGPFQLALREQIDVLPLVVEGSGSALPRATWLFGGTQDILLEALAPVRVKDWQSKTPTELRDHVRGLIAARVGELRGATRCAEQSSDPPAPPAMPESAPPPRTPAAETPAPPRT